MPFYLVPFIKIHWAHNFDFVDLNYQFDIFKSLSCLIAKIKTEKLRVTCKTTRYTLFWI